MADLEGELRELRPAALLQLLDELDATGMLRVTGHHHVVTVWLRDGVAVAADSTSPLGDSDLLDPLVDLLRTPAGSYRFIEGALAKPATAHEPDPLLLDRAVARLHEWESLADAVPSFSLYIKLLNSQDEDVALSSAAWSVSVSVAGGHASVAAVAKHLKWSSFKTCQAVRELIDAGRAVLVPPPKRRRRGAVKVDAPAKSVWHPANQPLWPGSGSSDRDRFSDAWAYEE